MVTVADGNTVVVLVLRRVSDRYMNICDNTSLHLIYTNNEGHVVPFSSLKDLDLIYEIPRNVRSLSCFSVYPERFPTLKSLD